MGIKPGTDTLRFGDWNQMFRHTRMPQLTVRRGDKWFGAEGAGITGRQLPMTDASGTNQLGIARIVSTAKTQFYQIRAHDLGAHHTRTCETYEGLLEAMLRAYPDFRQDEEVTLVYFVVEKRFR